MPTRILRHGNGTIAAIAVALLMLAAIGCDEDERLVEHARQSSERQAQQNETIARQSHAVTEQNRQIAEAARELVAQDAEARREMVQAQQELHEGVQAERSSLDRQREELEQERRGIAAARHRDPLVAEAIKTVGLWIACLLPLGLAGWVLHRMHGDSSDAAAVGELLVHELTTDEPKLLPVQYERPPAIEHRPGAQSDDLEDRTRRCVRGRRPPP